MEKKHFIYNCIVLLIFFVLSAACVTFYTNTKQFDDTRTELDGVREQLNAAENTNRELREQFEDCTRRVAKCKLILSDFESITNRNISTIRDCIEIVEETRCTIAYLSYYLDGVDTDSYYEWCDDYVGLPEEMR